jgi:DNA-binding MarR family transcriptional regulator
VHRENFSKENNNMSFRLHKHLRESLGAIRKPHHTSAHIAVLECLAYRIDDTKKYCFPSVETIGEESFMSERNARKIIKELEQDGLVQVEPFARK